MKLISVQFSFNRRTYTHRTHAYCIQIAICESVSFDCRRALHRSSHCDRAHARLDHWRTSVLLPLIYGAAGHIQPNPLLMCENRNKPKGKRTKHKRNQQEKQQNKSNY